MTVDDLKNLRDYHAQIASLKERIARLRDALASASSPRLTHMPRKQGPGDPVGNGAVQLLALKQELCDKIGQLEQSISRVECDINALPPRERAIIRARYVDGLGWKDVADKVKYSEDYCKEINSGVIKNLTFDVSNVITGKK